MDQHDTQSIFILLHSGKFNKKIILHINHHDVTNMGHCTIDPFRLSL